MTVDTIFDIASLTKVVATTTAIMQLEERGKVRLNDPVVKYIPEFGQNGKSDITVCDLLTHFSGLPPDLDLWTFDELIEAEAFEHGIDTTGNEAGQKIAGDQNKKGQQGLGNESHKHGPAVLHACDHVNFVVHNCCVG